MRSSAVNNGCSPVDPLQATPAQPASMKRRTLCFNPSASSFPSSSKGVTNAGKTPLKITDFFFFLNLPSSSNFHLILFFRDPSCRNNIPQRFLSHHDTRMIPVSNPFFIIGKTTEHIIKHRSGSTFTSYLILPRIMMHQGGLGNHFRFSLLLYKICASRSI